jgi:hypothetical protein
MDLAQTTLFYRDHPLLPQVRGVYAWDNSSRRAGRSKLSTLVGGRSAEDEHPT